MATESEVHSRVNLSDGRALLNLPMLETWESKFDRRPTRLSQQLESGRTNTYKIGVFFGQPLMFYRVSE